MYKVVVDVFPAVLSGTDGCHKYVFDYYRTKRSAEEVASAINSIDKAVYAFVEKEGVQSIKSAQKPAYLGV